MNWLYYLLEANLYLCIFYGFYRLLLHKETFYQLNRYYLIGASIFAFLLPLTQVSYLHGLLKGNEIQGLVYVTPTLTAAEISRSSLFSGDQWITAIYLAAVFALFLRLLSSLYRVFSLALHAPKQKHGKIIHIELKDSAIAFSFFNLLFINPKAREKQTIMKHELVHIRQRHSLDILFFEFLLAFNWFNPITWMIKKDIQLLHEYIADEATTSEEVKKHEYAMFLIQNSFGNIPNPLTSQIFNQSILKRRINMLNKKRSAGRARLRLLYVLPLTGGMLCASTLGFTKDYATIDLYARKSQPLFAAMQKSQSSPSAAQKPKEKQYFTIESRYDPKTGETINLEKRLLLLNGKKLKGKNIIIIEGYDHMTELKGKAATDKYGKSAANGALEFTGANIKLSAKFPPPIVTKDPSPSAANIPGPPAPPAPVKFPPPIVTKDRKSPSAANLPKPPAPPIDVKLVPPPPPPPPKKQQGKEVSFKAVDSDDHHFIAVPDVKAEQSETLPEVEIIKTENGETKGDVKTVISTKTLNNNANVKTSDNVNVVYTDKTGNVKSDSKATVKSNVTFSYEIKQPEKKAKKN